MANHQSSIKRIRQTKVRNERNHYYAKSMRTSLKNLRNEEDKQKAESRLPKLYSMIDKLVKKGIIHKNKAANLKSKLAIKIKQL